MTVSERPTKRRADVACRVTIHRSNGFSLDIALDLPEGRTTALLGPNGAGKSTAIDALAGLVRIDGGRIRIGDRVVDDPTADVFVPPARRRVGVVFQDGRLFDHLSVADNVAFGPRSRGLGRADARRRAIAWLDRLGLGDLAGRRPAELSGGQAQRAGLCRALASDPDLLLLDEPLSALDVRGRASLRRTLAAHLSELAAPRLLVTHDPIEAFLLADRVAVIEDGRLTQTGTPDEIRQHPRTTYIAELVGTNLLRGTASGGAVTIGAHRLTVADTTIDGAVLAIVHPRAIALSPERPEGSQRNVWRSRLGRVEHLGDRVRVSTSTPVPLTAEVTPGAVTELGLVPGSTVWLAIKATEIDVIADS